MKTVNLTVSEKLKDETSLKIRSSMVYSVENAVLMNVAGQVYRVSPLITVMDQLQHEEKARKRARVTFFAH